MNSAFAAIMNRPVYLPDSIVAQKDSAAAFSHSLDPKPTSLSLGEYQPAKTPADSLGGPVT